MSEDYGFETRMIHAGSRPEAVSGARQTPIFQNTSYVFQDVDHAADLFNLQDFGFIYSRLTNPTVSVLEEFRKYLSILACCTKIQKKEQKQKVVLGGCLCVCCFFVAVLFCCLVCVLFCFIVFPFFHCFFFFFGSGL